MHSMRLEPTKLTLVGARATHQANTRDAVFTALVLMQIVTNSSYDASQILHVSHLFSILPFLNQIL